MHEGTSYVLSVNPDTVLLAVDNTLRDHRMMSPKSNLPGCWASLPSRQAIATGNDVCIAQEEVVADKKKTPKKQWGVKQVTKLLHLTRVSSESSLPPIYTALAIGEGSPRLHQPTECV